ncbi:MAG TPA: cell division ATPase MinD [Candidatus Nanoarchaeia archaeon]|nr:cell division ATPase MinD [Candidatus Nanoarchaeia archaeon]
MKRVIVITSGKGGVGKTTTAINLGAAINHFGRDVLIVDGNLTTPNVGIHFGSPEVPVNLNHVLSNKAEAFEAVYEHDSGVKIIPSSLSIKELKKIKPEKLKDFKKDFTKISDYVIIDSAAGLGNEAMATIALADELIIVTNPEMPAITDALKTIKLAEEMKKIVLGVIINKVRKDDIEMQPDVVKEMLEVPILGMVPYDLDVPRSLSMKDAVVHLFPKSKPSRAYKEIAAKIINAPYDSNKDAESLMEIILRYLNWNKK